jgi:hypothetical protein
LVRPGRSATIGWVTFCTVMTPTSGIFGTGLLSLLPELQAVNVRPMPHISYRQCLKKTQEVFIEVPMRKSLFLSDKIVLRLIACRCNDTYLHVYKLKGVVSKDAIEAIFEGGNDYYRHG